MFPASPPRPHPPPRPWRCGSPSNRTIAVSFATEAGHFQRAGLPTVVCGPGSIDQAHKPDEFLSIDQLAECLAFLGRLAEEASS